jgi:flavin reductase (DIM6/NTAB) family NADH-FMN oxidoreductase RutF
LGRTKIDTNAFVYPMPMVLVGSMVDAKPNFMAVAWVSRVNFKPPMIAVALGPHHTSRGIHETGQFSVNVPGMDLLEKTDYCGIVSGSKKDKSSLFTVSYGVLEAAPLISECPVSMACRLQETVALPTNTLFIGEIVEAFSDERFLKDGVPDLEAIRPFALTMPDNRYWALGACAGRAWGIGKSLVSLP